MDTQPQPEIVTSTVEDVRRTPLSQASAATVVRRIRPAVVPGSDRVPVAAFNASL